jgi:mono/diheme cytochrome c family protein
MPTWLKYGMILMTALALVPPALIARSRAVKSTSPRVHPIPDMDSQPKLKAQQFSALFADHRAMRLPVEGTLARGDLRGDEHTFRGEVDGGWATTFPEEVTKAVMERGRERYEIFCSPCHGLDGAGRGLVAVRAEELQEGLWVPPLSFHNDQVLERPVGHLYNTIAHGIRTMPAYGDQIDATDRWGIVAYIRALQRAGRANIEDVPPDIRPTLR